MNGCEAALYDMEGVARMGCKKCDQSWGEDEVVICSQGLSYPLELPRPIPEFLKKHPVLNILGAAGTLFTERNRLYGDSYAEMGELLMVLFSGKGIPAIRTKEEANRLNLVINCLSKLQRYAHAFEEGGHEDSAEDLIVYAAMLRENT